MTDRLEYAFRGVHVADALPIVADAAAGGLPLTLLRALVPLPQTTRFHLSIGIHIEMAVLPIPLVPAPMPFLGVKITDMSLGQMIVGAAMQGGSAADAKVVVWGIPATAAGKGTVGAHVPLGSYAPLKPLAKGKLLFGSASVDMEGKHAVRLGEMGMCCSVVGVETPTGRVVSWPYGTSLVFTGGASVLDPGAALAMVIDFLLDKVLGFVFPDGTLGEKFFKAYISEVIGSIQDGMEHPEDAADVLKEIFVDDVIKAIESVAMDGINSAAGGAE